MRILITAGPTREFMDPVRYISNRSSGRMGYAIAEAALARRHDVVLISGPVPLVAPRGARLVRVVSAQEMLLAVRAHVAWSDALVMTAAVADWAPARCAVAKMKKGKGKGKGKGPLVLRMKRTPDILSETAERKGKRFFVGFAAETGNPVPEARRKLAAKKLDLIVANDVLAPGAGFDVATNRVTLVWPGGRTERLPLMTKRRLGERLVRAVESSRKVGA